MIFEEGLEKVWWLGRDW